MHAFDKESNEGRHPFVVGDLNEKKTFVHVFDAETLDRVLSELGTISDFVHYLSEKVAAIRSGKLALYAGEEELLAFYLQEQIDSGYGSLPFAHRPFLPGRLLNIPEGEWGAYTKSEAYRVRAELRERAQDWFDLLEPFTNAVISADVGIEARETPLEMHEAVLRVAASENLVSRARLASAFEGKRLSIPAGVRSSRVINSICSPGRLYVFVFVPWIKDSASYDEYRKFRLEMMQAYALVAPIKFIGVQEVVIVGAQTPDDSGTRSEAMICVRYEEPLSEQQMADAYKLMEDEQVLADVPVQSLRLALLPGPRGRRYGRNDPCPCGSLKKNKKCCNISGPRYGTIYTARSG